MNSHLFRRFAAYGWLCLLVAAPNACTYATEPTKAELDFFESKIRPLLIEHCYECHSVQSGESEGDLFIDSAAAIRRGGASGPLIKGKDPDKTLLMRVIRYDDRNLQMPPSNKLPQEAIDAIGAWISMGAPDPRTEDVIEKAASPLDRAPQSHWAFVPPEPAKEIPIAGGQARDLIDALAQTKADQANIAHANEASPQTLIRRLHYDLTGLPPSQSEIDSFAANQEADAYTRVVDQLLARPEFAERFARHWLDVARYADTVGYALGGKERRIKGSDRYRDWVIIAFASDMPYDEMIRHQLAGDRTDPANENGNLDAMGFLTIGRRFLNKYDTWDDRIDVITRGLLGMTVTCARCHDHKFDPIPAADYYSLLGVMQSSKATPEGASPLMMVDDNPHDSPVLLRGLPSNRGPIAPRQFLTALRAPDDPKFDDGSGRVQLADRIADARNPLTARVMVNRVWAILIGKPLVDSPSDFGFRTAAPATPQILDDLAADFASHWSIKRLVRRIVLTRIYRQSSNATDQMINADPENRRLTRANRRRRDFESMRDSMLHVTGSLDQRIGGEPVEITLATPSTRRSIYAMVDRQNLPSLFRTFDFASPDAHSPSRYFTTVPQQALYLLNDPQTTELAKRAAAVIRRRLSDNQHSLVELAYLQVLQRLPTVAERTVMEQFFSVPLSATTMPTDPRSLWTYGVAEVDDDFRVNQFVPMSVFRNGQWQVDEPFPSTTAAGYASLGKENGHPGKTNAQSVVRRWKAPASGRLRFIGMMGHRGDKGDGVRATFLVNNRSIFSETQVRNNRPFNRLTSHIKAGQFVDLVASPGQSDSFDSFFWRTQIRLTAADGSVYEADSVKDFSGPYDSDSTQPLDRLEQLIQMLMISNEFMFVD